MLKKSGPQHQRCAICQPWAQPKVWANLSIRRAEGPRLKSRRMFMPVYPRKISGEDVIGRESTSLMIPEPEAAAIVKVERVSAGLPAAVCCCEYAVCLISRRSIETGKRLRPGAGFRQEFEDCE